MTLEIKCTSARVSYVVKGLPIRALVIANSCGDQGSEQGVFKDSHNRYIVHCIVNEAKPR
jgi:hypothetical protein